MERRDGVARVDARANSVPEKWRTPARVDIDRIWYAPEFRRLGGVTQVVPPQDDFAFHDRLTHSMKVAQVAATLARKLRYESEHDAELAQRLDAAGIDLADWIDPDHCHAAGLAHDIGHPPYGHAGEQAIQEYLGIRALPLRTRSFEGNAQSTRIVATLSFRKPGETGLNLTFRSLAGIAKYPWARGEHPAHLRKLAKKWSFYPEETTVLDELVRRGFVATEKGEPSADRASGTVIKVLRWPEAEIMDWADDISYAVHDLEDFFRAGRIPLHRVGGALRHAGKHMFKSPGRAEWTTSTFDFAADDTEVRSALVFARAKMLKHLDQSGESLAGHLPDAFADIGNQLLDKMPLNRFDGSKAANTELQNFASGTISYLSQNTGIELVEFEGNTRVQFRVAPATQLVAEFFKALCQFYVIETSDLATLQFGQRGGVKKLVHALVQLAQGWVEADTPEDDKTLPARLREYVGEAVGRLGEIEEDPVDERAAEDRVRNAIVVSVVDYVCGLRDAQASSLAARLTGHSGSLGLYGNWLDS